MSNTDELRAIKTEIQKIAKEKNSSRAVGDLCDIVDQMAEIMIGIVKKQEKHVSIFRRIDEIIKIDLKKYF